MANEKQNQKIKVELPRLFNDQARIGVEMRSANIDVKTVRGIASALKDGEGVVLLPNQFQGFNVYTMSLEKIHFGIESIKAASTFHNGMTG